VDGSSSENNVDVESSLFSNGIPVIGTSISRHYQQSGDDGSVSLDKLVNLSAGDVVDLRMQFSDGGATTSLTFTTHNLTWNLIKL